MLLKKIIIFLLLGLFYLQLDSIFAQCPETNPNCNQVNHWVFGKNVHVWFSNGELYSDSIDFYSREASSVLSSGDILTHYASPSKIWNLSKKTDIDNIKGNNSSTQGALLFEKKDKIVFFSSGENNKNFNNKIYYYVLKDSTIQTNLILDSCTEQMSSVYHQNNNSIWIASHSSTDNSVVLFLLKNDLLCCPLIQNIGGNYSKGNYTPFTNGYQIKFSNSSKLVAAIRSESDWAANARVDLMKFNSENGILYSNVFFWFPLPSRICFSPDDSKFYISDNRLSQFSLSNWSNDQIESSYNEILGVQPFLISDLNISPNETIIFTLADSSFLGEISYPNKEGNNCKVNSFAYKLNSGKCQYGLPNFNASYFYTPSIDFAYTEDCWQHTYTFEGRDTLKATTWKWLFTKGNFTDSLLTKHGTYQFKDTGLWQVTHIATAGNRSDSVTKTLTIRPKWQQNILGNDTFYCAGQSPQLILKVPTNMHCVHWQGEEPNLEEEKGPIIDYNHFHIDSLVIDTAGIYTVKLTNKTFCQLWDTIKVEEKPKPTKPIISFATGELASTVIAKNYTWYVNDSFYVSTNNRSILPNRNGYYQLVLTSAFGCQSDKSDSFFVDLGSIVAPIQTNNLFKVYPNPNKGSFSIQVIKPGIYQIEITDIIGKQVYAAQESITTTKELNLQLSQGNYLVTVIDANGNRSVRQFKVE